MALAVTLSLKSSRIEYMRRKCRKNIRKSLRRYDPMPPDKVHKIEERETGLIFLLLTAMLLKI